jgi:DNA polymerase-3 subunit alpha
MTDEHPVLIYNTKTKTKNWVKAKNIVSGRKTKTENISTWNSFVCFPKIKTENIISEINTIDFLDDTWSITDKNIFTKKSYGSKSNITTKHYIKFNESIKLDYNFGFFIGLYTAEGSINRTSSTSIHLHKNESDLIKFSKEYFNVLTGKKPYITSSKKNREKYNGITITSHSTILVKIIEKLSGKYSHNKHLPDFYLKTPKEFQEGLYDGVLAGDGSQKNNVDILCQTSKTLAWQMKVLGASISNSFASIKEHDSKTTVFDNKLYKTKIQYRSNFGKKEIITNRKILFDSNYVYRPISEIKSKYYNGKVYNIEVEDDHSYVSDFIMHNCDIDLLKQHSEGLIILSGCAAGFIPHMLMEERIEEAIDNANQMVSIFGEDYYLEVQNHGIDWQQPMKNHLFKLSNQMGIPIVATQDSHFINAEDAELQNKICKLAAGDLEFETKETYFKTYEEMCQRFEPSEHHAIHRTLEVAEKCNCEWEFGKTIWPVYELPKNITPQQKLEELAWNGFKEKFGEGTQEYKDRLSYELNIINKMGFDTYFLVVQDFINWAKNHNIPVGAGRGSACGGLICYCINITKIDPIEYKLYFERFLNPARVSNPDVDVDFCPRGRKDVMNYVCSKYGEDKVAQIGTYSAFKPRGSLRDFARVCGYDVSVRNELASMVPADVSGFQISFDELVKARPEILQTDYPEVVELARKAEGLKTKMGVHAAGVVISDKPLTERLPLFRGKNDEVATQFDMHDVEELGLVKYDFLGLINLTIINDTLKLIKKTHKITIDIDNINKNDQEVFTNIFQKGELDGVFQFETSVGFKDLCMKVKPESISDLASITSLFRPGPLSTGYTNKYTEGKRGNKIEYLTPELEPILKETYSVLVYQEQIMRICTDLAGYTLSEADNMRRIIGKKEPEKMALEKDKFINGCINNNISKEIASSLFSDIEGFAKYCLLYDTEILTEEFGPMRIGDIVTDQIKCRVYSIDKNNMIYSQPIAQWHNNGEKEVFEYTLENGTTIKCTKDHKFMTNNGMVEIDEIFNNGYDLYIVN